jgi:hypothetical protein
MNRARGGGAPGRPTRADLARGGERSRLERAIGKAGRDRSVPPEIGRHYPAAHGLSVRRSGNAAFFPIRGLLRFRIILR